LKTLPILHRDQFRLWAVRNLQPLIFLAAYFFTLVVGNLLYATSQGGEVLETAGYSRGVLEFSEIFSAGYWILMLMPFVVTPLIVMLVRRLSSGHLSRLADKLPEFTRMDYLVLTMLCYAFLIYSAWHGGIFSVIGSGTDARSSVQTRFLILGQLGFPARIVLMSLLNYLTFYALIRWLRNHGLFWVAATIVNTLLMAISLTLLNMKWPILIFDIGLVLTIFVYAEKNVYFKVAIGAALVLMSYWAISNYVFRAVVVMKPTGVVETPVVNLPVPDVVGTPAAPTITLPPPVLQPTLADRVEHAYQIGRVLAFSAFNRMAIAYPYYYQIFTTEGRVCGGLLEQAHVGPACRPSTYIYTRIFGKDGFEGRGTSPAAVHISAYSLGGWPLAITALLAASVILGLFASLPFDSSATVGAFSIVGALAGYHFSQLPGEGPLLYDHGVIWTVVMLAVYAAWRFMSARITRSPVQNA